MAFATSFVDVKTTLSFGKQWAYDFVTRELFLLVIFAFQIALGLHRVKF